MTYSPLSNRSIKYALLLPTNAISRLNSAVHACGVEILGGQLSEIENSVADAKTNRVDTKYNLLVKNVRIRAERQEIEDVERKSSFWT